MVRIGFVGLGLLIRARSAQQKDHEKLDCIPTATGLRTGVLAERQAASWEAELSAARRKLGLSAPPTQPMHSQELHLQLWSQSVGSRRRFIDLHYFGEQKAQTCDNA